MARRVLVATFGSAGDLFPLVPVMTRLRHEGHDVWCAAPRGLGLYLRPLSLPTVAVGDGSEMRVFDDPGMITTRFSGWASWSCLARRYLAPRLASDVGDLSRVIERWRPDVVVSTSFAPAARVAAARRGVPQLSVSIYPQHERRLPRGRSFGLPLRTAVAELTGLDPREDAVTDMAWGTGHRTLLLHDRLLTAVDGELTNPVAGFPYWDAPNLSSDDLATVEAWLDGGRGPVVLVTMGSFLGVRQRAAWVEVSKAARTLGVRALFVGPKRCLDDEVIIGPGALGVGYIPLSRLVERVDAVVHHGGVGTMFAALRAGRPAVVVPQAFDQPHNARLVERLGAGLDAGGGSVRAGLERVLSDRALAARAREVAGSLVDSDVAVSHVVDQIVEVAG